jgi:tetratricopeptide (TPR) repeat protein
MWYYSDLNDIGTLNTSLQLTLKLRTPIGLSDRAMPLVLQRNLLEPFGMVKGLQDVQVLGNHSDEIEKRLRISMETPYRPAEKCLEDATNLSDAGIVASKTDPARAIALYLEAFEKIHIICDGRRRSVWGDGWFNIRLVGGRFDGEIGHVVKLILRTRLVLNIIKAYLDLKEYHEALFWGDRTIDLIRKSTGSNDDEPVLGFPAAMELGKIYYLSGIAAKVLGNTLEARRYLRVAAGYLPRDEEIKEELASVSPLLD